MGGPPVTQEMEDLILDTWLDMRTPEYEPAAKEVRYSVIRQLSKEDYAESDVPKLRTFQEYLRRARKERVKLQGAKIDEQKPWNMAALNELELSPESIPHILQVWRYSVNLGVEFTIRQAKWVSRLHTQVPDITELWFQSRRYSREEELSLLTGEPMKIYMLDGILVMGDWEFDTTLETDVLKPDIIRYIHHTRRQLASDGGIAEELLHAIPMSPLWEPQEESQSKRESELRHLITDLPASTNYFPDIESRMVYLRHLSYLSKGPKWNTLPPKEILDIIVELRKWVIDTKTKIDEAKSAKESRGLLDPVDIIIQQSYPLHLYDRVGYNFLNNGG